MSIPIMTKKELLEEVMCFYVYGGMTTTLPGTSTSMSIREVASSEVDLFATLHMKGYQEALACVSELTLRHYHESLKVLYQRPGWHLYLAWVNDIPSGMGMLYIQDGRASLAGGATPPNQRQQGVQTALLNHRVQIATQAQCTLIVSQAGVGSTSQHNMERLGMCTAYTGTAWTQLRAASIFSCRAMYVAVQDRTIGIRRQMNGADQTLSN